ncbi:hypothetical protein EIK77_008522 [Talaromyces pinophilus]|nr:hypothetical protein EIK77_008522 [Talaromyces pinophilus]
MNYCKCSEPKLLRSPSLRKGQSLRWSPYFNDCLQVLQEEKACENDLTLVQMAKFRLVTEKVIDSAFRDATRPGHFTTIPASFYIKSLEAELRECIAATPSGLLDNSKPITNNICIIWLLANNPIELLLLERYYTEFRIYEIGLSQSSDIFAEQPNLRLECLFACLQATKSYCTTLINIDLTQYPGLPALVTGQMTNCFACLCRLSMCEQSGWDRDIVNSTIDVSFFLQELEKKYAQVRETVGIDADDFGGSDYFTIKASKLRSMKASWDALTLTAISLQELESFSVDFLDACSW